MPFSGPFGSDQMPGGKFVYANVGGDFSALTTTTWDGALGSGTGDVWFKASFSQADAGAVPEPAAWAMMLVGFGFVGGAMRAAKRRQRISVSFG